MFAPDDQRRRPDLGQLVFQVGLHQLTSGEQDRQHTGMESIKEQNGKQTGGNAL